jgi:hypothetical protein
MNTLGRTVPEHHEGNSCLGLFDTCPCDATALRVAQT